MQLADARVSERPLFSSGTDGSNPVPSSGESGANSVRTSVATILERATAADSLAVQPGEHRTSLKDQRLVARGREKAGNQHIGIDDRPDHFTPPGVTRSGLRRFSAISASMSAAVRVSSPRRLAPLQAFCSQSGGGAAVRTKSCTLMMTTGGLAASVDDALPDVPPGMV